MARKFKTVMVNNSTNINKTNNNLSPQTNEYEKTMTYDIGNPGPVLGQTQACSSKAKFV
jgi:hypothetical protein